jgi:diguanylate cyclase (GGDEF)-like protein
MGVRNMDLHNQSAPRRRWSLGFKNQLVLAFSVGVITVAVISSFAIAHFSSQAVRQSLIEYGRQAVETLAAQSTLALLYGSPENAQTPAMATLAFPDIHGVSIYDVDGRELVSVGKRPAMTPGMLVSSKAEMVADRKEEWYFSAPVYVGRSAASQAESPFATVKVERELIGYVLVSMGKETVATMEKNILRTNVLVSTLLAGLLLALLLIITGRMTTPLKNLANKMRRAEEGEETVRADLNGPKEIMIMGMAFNTMMEVLEERQQALKRARDSALISASAKAEFAANVSHEIRTPMNGVLGMIELLQGTDLTEKQREYVEMARKSAETQLVLIEDILDFSRMDSGKLKPNPVEFSVAELLDEVIQISFGQARKKNIDLGFLVEQNVPTALRGEPTRIRQVLTNLVSNAIKFTHEGEIAIKVRLAKPVGDRVLIRFEVKDTGVGIPEEARQRIFEPFAQVDGSTTRKYRGVGLGLAICRQVVDFLGGEIGVESVLDEGSTFWFELPMGIAKQAGGIVQKHRQVFAGLRVLVIDNSEISRNSIEQTLALWGAQCETATEYSAAKEILRKRGKSNNPFNLVFVDESVPDISVKALIREINEDESIPMVGIILMTNQSLEKRSNEYRGVDEYIIKPVRQSVLFNTLNHLLSPKVCSDRVVPENGVSTYDAVHRGKRVLVVEDNRTNQQVALGMLERLGCHVKIAETGEEALKAVAGSAYDLVLMDCQMPEMDGYEATRRIRLQESGNQRVPIIAMTADTQPGVHERCIDAGMDDYLLKPVRLDELNEKLSLWTAVPQAHDDYDSGRQSSSSIQDAEGNNNHLRLDALDQIVIDRLRNSIGDAFVRMVEVFCEDAPKYLRDLIQAIAASDHQTMFSIAHTLKGGSRNFGAHRLAEISKQIEEIGRKGSVDNVDKLLSELEGECTRVIDALHREIGKEMTQKSNILYEGSQCVLIVDDDRATRLAVRKVLEEQGYRVETASDGFQAVIHCKRQMPDLILMDAVMPEQDGFTACERIRDLPGGRNTPILIITALEDDQSIERAFSVGATDYIPKPLHFGVLRQRIYQLLYASRAERRVKRLAYKDPLTGLPNRAMFVNELGELLTQRRNKGDWLALLFLDLDRFKRVNETMGHEMGDRLLKAGAERLVYCVRAGDLVARLGSDEFTIVLNGLNSIQPIAAISEKICKVLSAPFSILDKEIYISASIGISIYPQDGEDIGSLMKHADTAMFRAKAKGGRFQFYETGMEAEVTKKLELEADLRHALEGNELFLHYQPQMDLGTRAIVGMEALARWQHPERGLISPADFIPLAEETGLIIPLGEMVLRRACEETQSWLKQGLPPLRVAVNLSGRQLEDQYLVQKVTAALMDTGLNPNCLEFEITESTVMENPEEVIHVLAQLKKMGLTLAIDDFGTGYSSLSYLRRFPIDLLKIDASFVRDIASDPDDRALISGIIALAKSIRLKVVAEGVETSAQEAFLIEQGCDAIQGYLIGAPMEASVFQQKVFGPITGDTSPRGKVITLHNTFNSN